MKLGRRFHHGDTANMAEKGSACAALPRQSQSDTRATNNGLHSRRAAVFAVVNVLGHRIASAEFYRRVTSAEFFRRIQIPEAS
ncbi:MAG: hypothetical protein K9K30_02370 [Burkholderiaceae bacterium]|nr:hypothetical protein [Sulfuritalea sp.]MCF8174061.1 hypothetical protein [Burkholderiaceae bacterium]MCF8183687.1 hypothetical protein [Polynucleobacter sp.]